MKVMYDIKNACCMNFENGVPHFIYIEKLAVVSTFPFIKAYVPSFMSM